MKKYIIAQENCGSWAVYLKPESRKPVREYQLLAYFGTREECREYVRARKVAV